VPVMHSSHAGKARDAEQNRLCYIPPQTTPGLGPPRTLERDVGTAFPNQMPNE